MTANEKRLILWIIIGLLAVPPIVRYFYLQRESNAMKQAEVEWKLWEEERKQPEALQKKEKIIKKEEKEMEQLIHGDRLETKIVSSSMETIPSLDDLLLFPTIAISQDSAKIAIAGEVDSSHEIYVADFPLKDKRDFKKVASIPVGAAIYSMRWHDFDSNTIGLISLEARASNEDSSDSREEKFQLALYTIDTVKKEKKERFVGNAKMLHDILSRGEGCVSFCWEQPNDVLIFDGKVLNRIRGDGKTNLYRMSSLHLQCVVFCRQKMV